MEDDDEKPFAIEKAKTGRAKCKKCKNPIDKDEVRIARMMANPFGEGKMKAWHHVNCLFEVFAKQRATTKRIEDPEADIDGWAEMDAEDKKEIMEKISEFEDSDPFKALKKKMKAKENSNFDSSAKKNKESIDKAKSEKGHSSKTESTSPIQTIPKKISQDDKFSEFQRLCHDISNESSYLEKTAIVKKFFTQGSQSNGFQSDIILWCRLLLPLAEKRIYNLQSKALIKLFSRILGQNEDAMLEDLEQGDVAQTIEKFFEKSSVIKPLKTSELTLQEVDEFLDKLSKLTKEDEQTYHFKSIVKRCTANDLKMIIRLIKRDLRINTGPKHILAAVHKDAYTAFQVSQDLVGIIKKCLGITPSSPEVNAGKKAKLANLSLMTPVLPMLAEACKSVEMAMEKCPNGMFSEVKYDGERVQVHKNGSDFRYFSRSLKPVLPHKVNFLQEYIPKAFPSGDDLIIDAEILMIDTRNGQPLPFGTLGVHKKNEFKHANVCLFIFDIIFYNGESLLERTIKERRKLLEEKMIQIPNRIVLSEVEELDDPDKLAKMISKVFKLGLEGLVLKDLKSKYEPGKRHWLKIKKDYLLKGAMADTADLVVIGAWYGTGQKGGMMSIFLMGCHDPTRDKWLTVTKVHSGHDDATLALLQKKLDMIKISKDPNLVPSWLIANKPMVPDFVARDPKVNKIYVQKQPVWEITGAEFTNQGVHTADGISIRFPRVTRIRDDKDWKTATNLQELHNLFNKSADSVDFLLLQGGSATDSDNAKSKKKIKAASSKVAADTRKVDETEAMDDECVSANETKSSERKRKRKSRDETDSDINETSPKKSKKTMHTSEEKDKDDLYYSDVSIDGQKKAAYYSFIGTDYIEHDASGYPLNWVEGRKPHLLPKNAKPISELDRAEVNGRCILPNVRVCFAKDLSYDKMSVALRTLKTLGAVILSKSERSQATHVIHGRTSIPATFCNVESGIPKLARHVTEEWINAAVARCKTPNAVDFAVTLSETYCSCLCARHK
ncbi:DNA ligase 3 isoform X1 [Trichogramma pretiosum]|uniref:DNA ligase 3 isoform X1 n=1 Tax=Trichogramma pretiosum TaxID=7493 RepID=UPI0006C978BF|nr:DNA ligase 3 isoform X1 [Trichogramma pretiosum]